MDSILASVKAILGIPAEDTFFNGTLVMHINTVFNILAQLGCSPAIGFAITGPTETWHDMNPTDPETLNLIKTYLGEKVRSIFDPPANGTVSGALDRQLAELEWRINAQFDPVIAEQNDDYWYGRFNNLDDDEF